MSDNLSSHPDDLTGTAPAVDVWPPPPETAGRSTEPGPLANARYFREQNMLLLLVLAVITLGFYFYFWMYRQIKVINQVDESRPIWTGVFWSALGLGIISIIWSLFFDTDDRTDFSRYLRLGNTVLFYITIYSIRHSLNRVFQTREGYRIYAGKAGTFLLGAFYLQYKINRIIQTARDQGQIN